MSLKISDKALKLLKGNPNKHYTAREIAEWIFATYEDECREKQQNSKAKKVPLDTDEALVTQIQAEVNSNQPLLLKKDKNVKVTEDRPKRFYYSELTDEQEVELAETGTTTTNTFRNASDEVNLREHDLYYLLSQYLFSVKQVLSKRIDEKRSSNSKGSGGNEWLHPDIVGLERISNNWHDTTKDFLNSMYGRKIKLWSFEVKVLLNSSNVRKDFFQTVSNSSWANFGYLVAKEIRNTVMDELRMLSNRHGIGLIKLDVDNPSESQILIPAKEKSNLDWGAINRLVEENTDFNEFIDECENMARKNTVRDMFWDYEPEED